MQWTARRKAAWLLSAWLGTVGPSMADGAVPDRLSREAAEQAPPPVVVPAPSVTEIPAPSLEEFQPRPLRVRVLAIEALLTDAERLTAPTTLPPAAPAESASVDSTGMPPQGGCCEPGNPWAKIPQVQPFPRLGLFLVPGSGPGYYSFLDLLHDNYRPAPPSFPYPPLALQPPSGFDADYRYLDRPDNTQVDPFDALKRIHPTPDLMVTVGGQHSARYMKEVDSRLGTVDNDYTLFRNRVWADVWYRDSVRVYGEFISALVSGNELPPQPIDENRADILNLFAEVKLFEVAGNPAYLRFGRQELLFGSQRLVSTLDWANTRRTFEGARAFTRSETFDLDLFLTRPVVIEPGDADAANDDVEFYGAWATVRPRKGLLVDLYYLGLNDDSLVRERFRRVRSGRQQTHTFGSRVAGNEGPFLFDFEGMVQTGTNVDRDRCAYAYTTALGWEFSEHPWRPQVWAAYDYASGTADPGSGDDRTFNQLFAFGHYYLGYIDAVGRQNIQDLNFQLAAYPDNWITVVFQYHHFRLAESRDFLYSASGRPTRRSPTGAAGTDVGQEFDFLANFHLTSHQDLLIGYSKLFAGDFIRATGDDVSPELFYLMYNFRW